MSPAAGAHAMASPHELTAAPRARGLAVAAENLLLTGTFAILVALPLAEIALRAVANVGFEGSSSLTQHLTFVIAVLGAAVAAREDRLLGFSAVALLGERLARHARIAGCGVAAAVSAIFALASVQFVAAERAAGRVLAHGIPVWLVEALLPAGFVLVAARLLVRASDRVGGRTCATLIALALTALLAYSPLPPRDLVAPGLVLLGVATLLGAPLFAAIGGAGLLLLWGDGVPIAAAAVNHYGLTANPSLPAKTAQEVINYAKAQPGKVAFSSSGAGTSSHLAAEMFKSAAKIDMLHVPYKGGGPSVAAAVSGEVQLTFNVITGPMPMVRAGKLRAIAVTSPKRAPAAPEVPTVAESGLPGFEMIAWYNTFAPGRTPDGITRKLNAEFNRILQLPDVREKLSGQGVTAMIGTPADLSKYLDFEVERWAKVIKEAGIKLN